MECWPCGATDSARSAIPRSIDALRRFHRETVGPYWPAERAIVDRGYDQLAFPFDEISAPEFAMEVEWTLDQFAGYVGTWSAVQRARAATGADPVPDFVDGAPCAHGAEERATRAIAWPLSMRVGRV